MTLDIDITAGGRTQAARNLIGRAQDGLVDLAIVTALELCWLGGPAHPLFDELPARAWTGLGRLQRGQVADQATRGLVRRRTSWRNGRFTRPCSPLHPPPRVGWCRPGIQAGKIRSEIA